MLSVVKRLIELSGKRKKRMYLSFVFAVFEVFFTMLPIMAVALILEPVMDAVNGGKPITSSQVIFWLGFMIFAVAGRCLFAYLVARTQESIGYEMFAEQRIQIGDSLKRVPLGFFGKKDAGDITSAVTTDMNFVENYSMKLINKTFMGFISAIMVCLMMFWVNVLTGLIALLGVILTSLIMIKISKKSREVAPVRQANQARLVSAIIEYVRGISIVKSFKQEGIAKEGIETAFENSRKTNYEIERDFNPIAALYLFVFKICSVGISCVSAMLALNGDMEMSMMLMMLTFSFVLYSHVEQLGNNSNMIRMIDASLDRIDVVRNAKPIDLDSKPVTLRTYDIDFEHVSFGYETRMVLKDISFHIPENTTTAIVGTSGGGKSTICNLIARFYDADQGTIKVGGVDVRKITCDSLLSNISMVFQKVYLFHDTVLNNIKFGNPTATKQEIIDAAKRARCHDFIMELPDGYDTVVGEGGDSLSGGQKQRISIARAILKDAPIVILDEATASVDPENEHYIQEAINELTHGKTIIIIAHRLATIEQADQILVVQDGRIIQRGRHEELMKQNGLYQRFIGIRQKAEGWKIETREA